MNMMKKTKTLKECWPHLSQPNRLRLSFEAGKNLALLHNYTGESFGELARLANHKFPTWYRYVQHHFKRNARQALNMDLIPNTIVGRIKFLLDRYRPILEEVRIPSFLHNDFLFANILVFDNEIVRINFVGRGLLGDPAFDYKRENQLEMECPGSVSSFYSGYESIRPLDPYHHKKVSFYELLLRLECIVDLKRSESVDSKLIDEEVFHLEDQLWQLEKMMAVSP